MAVGCVGYAVERLRSRQVLQSFPRVGVIRDGRCLMGNEMRWTRGRIVRNRRLERSLAAIHCDHRHSGRTAHTSSLYKRVCGGYRVSGAPSV